MSGLRRPLRFRVPRPAPLAIIIWPASVVLHDGKRLTASYWGLARAKLLAPRRTARGHISPYFITNADKMRVEMEDPYILIYEKSSPPSTSCCRSLRLWCRPASHFSSPGGRHINFACADQRDQRNDGGEHAVELVVDAEEMDRALDRRQDAAADNIAEQREVGRISPGELQIRRVATNPVQLKSLSREPSQLRGFRPPPVTLSSLRPLGARPCRRARYRSPFESYNASRSAVLDEIARSPSTRLRDRRNGLAPRASVKPLLTIPTRLLRCELDDTRKIRSGELPPFLDFDQAEPSRLP